MTDGCSGGFYEFGYRAPRYCVDFRLMLQMEGPGARLVDARCVDISEDGVALQVVENMPIGAHVNLVMTFPESSTSLRIAARVANRRGRSYGLAFIFTSQTQRDLVNEYISSLNPAALRFRPASH